MPRLPFHSWPLTHTVRKLGFIVLLAAAALLVSCGQTGPLKHPQETPPPQQRL